jgi:uncharacterized membrane protein YraQ (UPF0718 family)
VTVSDTSVIDREANLRRLAAGSAIFVAIAILGLFFVKWWPYWHKSFVAANAHSIGSSIITGKTIAPQAVGLQAAWTYSLAYFRAVWQAVVLALVLGASIQVLVPRAWLVRMLGGNGARPALVAGAASMLGMMCTCCTAPIVVGLRKQRAGMGSALAFFLGNPVLNPAVIIFMGFVLGWAFAGLRVIFGVAMVALVAYIANKYAVRTGDGDRGNAIALAPIEDSDRSPVSLIRAWFAELWVEIYTLLPGYAIIVFVLGGVRAWLFPPGVTIHASGFGAVTFLAAIGTIFVIPTAGEIPLAQTLMHAGMGAGPAMALLITLPAISLPSLFIVRKVFPARLLWIVLACVFAIGAIAGLVAMFLHPHAA